MSVLKEREIVLKESCPRCKVAGTENPLRNQLGGFATYCLDARNNKVHEYNDSQGLRDEIRAAEHQSAVLKDVFEDVAVKEDDGFNHPPAPRPSPPIALSELKPAKVVPVVKGPAAAEAQDIPKEALMKLSEAEPPRVMLTDVDCYRLSELLGNDITGAAELVGAVYGLRNELSELRGIAERREQQQRHTVAVAAEADIPQRADGGLSVQIYVPEPQAKMLCDRVVFNGQTVGSYVQGMMEYQMAASYFPIHVLPHPQPSGYDGVWALVNIPEAYVGSMVDMATTSDMTPTEYMQNYVHHLIGLELFP